MTRPKAVATKQKMTFLERKAAHGDDYHYALKRMASQGGYAALDAFEPPPELLAERDVYVAALRRWEKAIEAQVPDFEPEFANYAVMAAHRFREGLRAYLEEEQDRDENNEEEVVAGAARDR